MFSGHKCVQVVQTVSMSVRSGMFYASKLSIIKKQISIYHAMEKTALSYSLYKIFSKLSSYEKEDQRICNQNKK